eukprot:CAMPEP_0204843834 /NCGR_PEP_ID=MMETSP1346-20131115/48217_1 /ASSEMBLY_ACC=CAM_ASM_000771 /TAXON_ID=215587 /ORGANISM="Aplanochytrium stocchinoi, Strain GSBS06" /LENGTH=478 /DNA_ID=CAMNT_0051983055 /DNA_START=139 /DNA_END=1575 /DNA_ORIENTATION=+
MEFFNVGLGEKGVGSENSVKELQSELGSLKAKLMSDYQNPHIRIISFNRLVVKACVDLVFLIIGIAAVALITDSEQAFSLCGSFNSTCTNSEEVCENLCSFKKLCAVASFFGLIPVFAQSMETIAVLRKAMTQGDRIVIDSRTNDIFPATLANTHLMAPLKMSNFILARLFVAALECVFLICPVNNCSSVRSFLKAWLTVPDALFNLFLLPLSFAIIGSAENAGGTLIGLIAVQLFAHVGLDDLITEKLCNRYAAIGETLSRVYVKSENDEALNRVVLSNSELAFSNGDILALDSSEVKDTNIVYVVNQIKTFGFSKVILELGGLIETESIYVLANFLRGPEASYIIQLELRFDGSDLDPDIYDPIWNALIYNQTLEKLALSNGYFDDGTIDYFLTLWLGVRDKDPKLETINFKFCSQMEEHSGRVTAAKIREFNDTLKEKGKNVTMYKTVMEPKPESSHPVRPDTYEIPEEIISASL